MWEISCINEGGSELGELGGQVWVVSCINEGGSELGELGG